MEKRVTFKRLVYNTCVRIIWQFLLAMLLLYLIPLLSISIEFISINSNKSEYGVSSIFLNIFSWIYICIALIVIVSFNIFKMLKLIKREMDIVYHKSMWLEPQCKHSVLTLDEFIETNKRIDTMQYRIKEMMENEKKQKEDLIFKVSAASHDLKTPLTVIQGNSELLLYSDLKDEQREYLSDIIVASDKISNYFNLLINYSKTFYDGKLEWQNYSVCEVIETIRQEIFFILKDKSIFKLENKIEKDRVINLNLNYVVRAISNIINNSLEYAKSNDKKIEMKVDYEDEKLIFTIWNNGSLFSQEVIDNCGKLFYRQNKDRNGDKSHYGIGLAFVKRVAELHGGELIISNSNYGAEVILSLGVA
ncbi:MAG: HAMP domain-containing sensor histidine kinase [Parvimonas sp.]|uniref:sensor histidine kinase n=2 Tax=Bacillota TaxID=1239 RepID=UPI002A75F801|nr:HAMP domain-containing sensor histidine kinase [Parvimonas sp.]MDY3050936.1 HAMP domain-containing sensor histidine kinase [Parvimonas sp.]